MRQILNMRFFVLFSTNVPSLQKLSIQNFIIANRDERSALNIHSINKLNQF